METLKKLNPEGIQKMIQDRNGEFSEKMSLVATSEPKYIFGDLINKQ